MILGTGVGTCAGLSFISGSVWMLGLIPVGIGLCMLVGGFLFTTKSDPGTPPLGWSADSDDQG